MKSFVTFSVILSAFLLSGCEQQKCNKNAKQAVAQVKKEVGSTEIYFAHDSHVLDEESRCELDSVVVWMKKNPSACVTLAGHTSVVGKAEYNMKLSMKRAEAVKEYLADHGIEVSRIKCEAHGDLPAGKINPKKNRVVIVRKYA